MAPPFTTNYEIFGLYLIRGKDKGKVKICILRVINVFLYLNNKLLKETLSILINLYSYIIDK